MSDDLPPLQVFLRPRPAPILFHESKLGDPNYEPYDVEVIPDTGDVPYEDDSYYHVNPMYKKLLAFHIGLITRHIVNTYQRKHELHLQDFYRGSFPKANEIKEYRKCGSLEVLKFPIEEDVPFEHVAVSPSFSLSMDFMIHVVRKGLTLFILFPAAYAEDIEKIGSFLFSNFFVLINRILPVLRKVSQIVCCGHSAGMRHATLCGFLLSCLRNPRFLRENMDVFYSEYDVEQFETNPTFRTVQESPIRAKIYIVGTGGAPFILKKNNFIRLYNELGGRYVHVYSALQTDRTFYIDRVANQNFGYDIHSLKYGVYYSSSKTIFEKYHLDTCMKGSGTFIIRDSSQNDIQSHISTYCKKETEVQDVEEYFNESDYFSLENNIDLVYKPNLSMDPDKCKTVMNKLHSFTTYRNLLAIFVFTTVVNAAAAQGIRKNNKKSKRKKSKKSKSKKSKSKKSKKSKSKKSKKSKRRE